jgi:hypothetical protein
LPVPELAHLIQGFWPFGEQVQVGGGIAVDLYCSATDLVVKPLRLDADGLCELGYREEAFYSPWPRAPIPVYPTVLPSDRAHSAGGHAVGPGRAESSACQKVCDLPVIEAFGLKGEDLGDHLVVVGHGAEGLDVDLGLKLAGGTAAPHDADLDVVPALPCALEDHLVDQAPQEGLSLWPGQRVAIPQFGEGLAEGLERFAEIAWNGQWYYLLALPALVVRNVLGHAPPGNLLFQIHGIEGTGGRQRWMDTPKRKLESKISEIALGLMVVAEVFREEDKKRRIEDARREEENRRWEEEWERQQLEKARLAHLEKMVEAHAKATRIRALVAAVRMQPMEPAVEEWTVWATGVADSIDPATSGKLASQLRIGGIHS